MFNSKLLNDQKVCLSFFPTSEGFTMLMNLQVIQPKQAWSSLKSRKRCDVVSVVSKSFYVYIIKELAFPYFFSGDVLYCSMVWNSFYFNDSWDDQNCLCFIVWDGLKSTASLGIGNGCKEERGTSRPATMKATVSIVFATPSLPGTPCSLADKFTQH